MRGSPVARKPVGHSASAPLSLLLVEGDTERLFYERVKAECLVGITGVKLENIRGLWNVNKKIMSCLLTKYREQAVRVYCCLDRESRYSKTPEFDLPLLRNEIRAKNLTNILSMDAVIATQMIESWMLYDIEGIYKFIRAPKARRRVRSFRPPEKCRKKDLQRLFKRCGKFYIEGKRAKTLIDALDLQKIATNCVDLRDGIELIQSQATDTTSHLFP